MPFRPALAPSFALITAVLLACPSLVRAEDKKVTFDDKAAIADWTVKGDVSIDTTKNRDGKDGGALKIAPGAKAAWKLSDTDVSGTLEFWIYEDGTAPADPKASAAGATWGLIGKDGKALVVGPLYAKYLGGDATYAAGDFDSTDPKESPARKTQYLGVNRTVGWHKWTFKMDPDKGLSLQVDGKDVNAKKTRFDWNKTRLAGISSLVFYGDTTKDARQTLWIDDVIAALGAPMNAKPGGAIPAAAPGTVPAADTKGVPAVDPAPDHPVQLVAAMKGKHPRVLFSAEELPRIKALANSPEGKPFMDQLLAYLPSAKAPSAPNSPEATDAQRQGLWRAPTVALHYALTGDKKSLENARGMLEWMIKQEHWETGAETDSGMGAANIAVGAGILYDTLYNDLDPAFRETARQKLLLMARRQYYLGHLNGNHSVGYWQGDPQNNHRWHRDAGLTSCLLAIAGDGPGDEFMLSKMKEELDFVTKWLPDDGTSHESPSYWVFGSPHLTIAVDAADRCLGTKYLDLPYFKAVPMFRMQTLAPDLKTVFAWGDFGGTGGINSFEFLSSGHFKEADLQDGLLKFYKATTQTREGGKLGNPAFEFGVYSLLWFDPSVKGGSIENLPRNYYFDDLGLAFARDGWTDKNVAMMFKCAPYGGYKLNEYRREKGMAGVNVAHDDPDVNQFQIFAGGQMLAHDDGYSEKKLTSSHNTILVNGVGQRGEGGVWMQPLKGGFDMERLGVMTTWKETPEVVVAEGEGAGAYIGLDRYRRTAVWVKGSYILLLDDIRAPKDAEITWLVQGKGLEAVDAGANKYVLKTESASCPFMIASDATLTSKIAESTADHRGKPMGLQQLQAKATGKAIRYATVFDPWKKGDLKVEIKATDADHAVVTVTGTGVSDTWTWTAAPALSYTPSTLKGERKGGFSIDVGAADRATIPTPNLPAMQAADSSEKPAKKAPKKAKSG